MPGLHRENPVTREIVYRVYPLPVVLREAVGQRRQALSQSLRQFIARAVEEELPRLLAALREHLPPVDGVARPARLPLTEPLLGMLRDAGVEVALPASRLLLACLARAARRRRRSRVSGRRVPAAQTEPRPPTNGSKNERSSEAVLTADSGSVGSEE
jgi:hypothetical protein